MDIVPLADLRDYYHDTLHAKFVRNNITPDNKKRFIWDRLTHEHQEKIETIAAQYPLDFLQ